MKIGYGQGTLEQELALNEAPSEEEQEVGCLSRNPRLALIRDARSLEDGVGGVSCPQQALIHSDAFC